ncbi:hypothetical protein ACSQ76_11495 [Roseovarius sp. B08]|uniref:hypothetical protein n=1 Tax=Roseovarius sp. B08 TaxID=3449223 RepID=UPI003EDC13FE
MKLDIIGFTIACPALSARLKATIRRTVAWAGKSAAFGGIDYARRDWVPGSGWPIDHHDLGPHLDRAAASLNLGANCYDDRLWTLMKRRPPEPRSDPAVLGSFFWQFSRSTIRPMEVMHVGTEFVNAPARGCRIMTDATALENLTDATGKMATGVRSCSVFSAEDPWCRQHVHAWHRPKRERAASRRPAELRSLHAG